MSEIENSEPWGNLIEAWIDKEGVSTVKIAAWQLENPNDFGRFVADVVRHGSLAYSTTYNISESTALEEICSGLCDQLREQVGELIVKHPGSLDS